MDIEDYSDRDNDCYLLEQVAIKHLHTEFHEDPLHHMLAYWLSEFDIDKSVSDTLGFLESISLPSETKVIEDSLSIEESEDVTDSLISTPLLELKLLLSELNYVSWTLMVPI